MSVLVSQMSALPPKADIFRGGLDVRYVPIADIQVSSEACLNDWREQKEERRWSVLTSVLSWLLCPGDGHARGKGTPRGMWESSAPF